VLTGGGVGAVVACAGAATVNAGTANADAIRVANRTDFTTDLPVQGCCAVVQMGSERTSRDRFGTPLRSYTVDREGESIILSRADKYRNRDYEPDHHRRRSQ
jgi:hypothetical protein